MSEVPFKSDFDFKKLEKKFDLSEEKEKLSKLLPVEDTFRSLRNLLLAKNQLMGHKDKIFQNSDEFLRSSILPHIKTVVFGPDHDKPIGKYTPGRSKMISFLEKMEGTVKCEADRPTAGLLLGYSPVVPPIEERIKRLEVLKENQRASFS